MNIGVQELIIVAILCLIVLVVPISVVIGIVMYVKSKNNGSRPSHSPAEARLAELHHLRSQNLITEADYEAQKKKALNDL